MLLESKMKKVILLSGSPNLNGNSMHPAADI